jgi:hypothetical protein
MVPVDTALRITFWLVEIHLDAQMALDAADRIDHHPLARCCPS